MMVRKKLILASNSGGHSEILKHKKNGLIYKSGDIEDLKEKIIDAFSLDQQTRDALGEQAASDVKTECDPSDYFQKKMESLKRFRINDASDHSFFPFINISNQQLSNETREGNKLLSIVIPYFNMGKYIQE